MSGKILTFARQVNGVKVEQRRSDGFINATAMCAAHGKKIAHWFENRDTLELFYALAEDLGMSFNHRNSDNSDFTGLSAAKYGKMFPGLVFSKRGSPDTGGGTWLHPDLAIQLAQWCNKPFAIQVSRWVREWLMSGINPVSGNQGDNLDQEWLEWQQRYDIRVYLKDFLRLELMKVVVRWAEAHNMNPRKLCADVHDAMNERIQGAKSQQIRLMGGLPIGRLLRDYFEAAPLVDYSAINKLAKNAIEDRGVAPVQAVHEACDHYLGKAYTPKPVRIAENLHAQGRRLKAQREKRRLAQGVQLNLWDAS